MPERDIRIFHELNIIIAFSILAISFYRYSISLKHAENELMLYHGRIHRMAHTDTLTNLPNRRNVEDELQEIMKYRDETDEHKEIVVALGDLDDFKKINDTYGHKCGDKVLIEIAKRFNHYIRNNDFLGRWGGEEFIFIFKNTTIDLAFETMERIRIASTSEPITCSEHNLHVTVTFGVSCFHKEDTKESLFERVDELLYKGKKAGKNRVMSDI